MSRRRAWLSFCGARRRRLRCRLPVAKLRERVPNLVLRTTFITGFPGETDEQFEELCQFVKEMRFQRMGVFSYSLEPGTPAVKLDDHLTEEVKEQRRERLMELQQQIAFEFGESLVGYELDVLIDEATDEEGVWIGRTYADAPEIDGVVYLHGQNLQPGQLVPAEIVAADEYDLIAQAVRDDEAACKAEIRAWVSSVHTAWASEHEKVLPVVQRFLAAHF